MTNKFEDNFLRLTKKLAIIEPLKFLWLYGTTKQYTTTITYYSIL